MEFFGSDSDDEDTLDNHAIDQLLAACMRLVPPLAGLRPALHLEHQNNTFLIKLYKTEPQDFYCFLAIIES